MRIGVSALALRSPLESLGSGIARYCAGLLGAWAEDGGDHEFVVWVSPGFEEPEAWRNRPHLSFEVAAGPWSRHKTLWEWWSAGSAARATGCDVWFSSAHAVPMRSPVPTVLSIQDLFTFTHPEFYTLKHRLVIGRALKGALRRAEGFVAISRHTRDELAQRFGIAPEHVAVTPLGLDERIRPLPAAQVSSAELKALGVGGERYLLTLSTVEPRKNLPRLFEAFARVAAEEPDLRLVVAGRRGWKTAPIYRRPSELAIADRVDFVGYVPDVDLPKLFARCQVFVLPSIIEGFGLPLLEAMAFGAPVACSHAGSLREVGGDVPSYFDPLDVEAMATAIRARLGSDESREEAAARGRRRAERFSWADTAARTLEALVSAGGGA
ncbi:MAG: glycosyltransferase family 1 protein [Acidobacteria bacterium]|nr:glycosyltransferase family 1 protein [Acidobacteriota bacterium]